MPFLTLSFLALSLLPPSLPPSLPLQLPPPLPLYRENILLVNQDDFVYEEKIASLVEPFLKHAKVNAVSIGVIANGNAWTGNFGTLSKDGESSPHSDTIYEIGSISKVLTGVLLADAVVANKRSLDDPISLTWKSLAETNPKLGNTITFAHLATHRSGLPVLPTNFDPVDPTNPYQGYDRAKLNEYLKSATPTASPGESHEYSNLGAGLLGDLLAQQADLSYEQLLQTVISQPLGMANTAIQLSPEQLSRLAPPHNSALLRDHSWEFDALVGCGGIRSTVDDMLLFAHACLNPPPGRLGEALELAWQEQTELEPAEPAMGLGWMIAGDGSTRWHNGQTGGYHSMILINRKLNCAVVMLTNTAAMQLDRLAEQIFQACVGMEVQPIVFPRLL